MFTLVFVPVLMQFVAIVMNNHNLLNNMLVNGFIVVSCMPPPVSSAVILTKAVGGNDAGAIFNSALGSFLGIFVSPSLILMTLGLIGDVPFVKIFAQLCGTVILPIAAGQYLRPKIIDWMEKTKPPFGTIASATLLLIIYSAFCDTFSNTEISLSHSELLTVLFFVVIIQVSLLYIVFTFTQSTLCNFSRPDTVCAMYCATHKSLTLGIPMLKLMYSGDPALSFITIPLLMYHPCQILLGGIIAPKLKTWMLDENTMPI